MKNEMKNEMGEANAFTEGREGNKGLCTRENGENRETARRRLVVSFRPGRRRECKVTFGRLHRAVMQEAALGLGCVAVAVMVCGCQVLTYSSPSGERFTRSSLGSKTSVAHLTFEAGTNGVRKLQLRGYENDSSQSLGVVTDAAVKAAISAVKP